MSIDVTAIGLGVDTSKLRQGTKDLDAFGRSANNAAGKADQSTKSMSGMATMASRLAIVLGAAGLTKSLINVIDANTKYTAQLKLATQSQEQFNLALADVQRIARTAQSDIGSVATLYARLNSSLRDVGVTQQEVARITENVGLALKVSGATASESSSAILQLSQAFASGVLRGEEFNAVSESAPALMRALAESMGVPIGQLRSMAAEGQITGEILNRAFGDEKLLEKFRQQAKEVNTISSAFTVLTNELSAAAANLAKSSGLVDLITGAINGLTQAIIFLRENLSGAEIRNGLTNLIPGAGFVKDVGRFAATISRNRRIATGQREPSTRNPNSIGGASAITSQSNIAPNFNAGMEVQDIREIHRLQEQQLQRQEELNRLRDAAMAKQNAEEVRRINVAIFVNEQIYKQEQERIEAAKKLQESADKELAENRKRIMEIEQRRADENFKQAQDAYKKQSDEYNRIFERANDNLSRSLTDSIVRGFERGEKFIDNFKNAITRAFRGYFVNIGVNFVQESIGKIVGGLGRSILGAIGLGGPATALAGQTGVSGILDQAKSVFDVITKGFDGANAALQSSIESFGALLSNGKGGILDAVGGAIGQYSSVISGALPFAGAALKLLQGDVKGAAFQGGGAALGSIIAGPVGGAIGAALGSLAGGLFGGEKKLPRYYTGVASRFIDGQFIAGRGKTGADSQGMIKGVEGSLNNLNRAFSEQLGGLFQAAGINQNIGTNSLIYQKNNTLGRFDYGFGGRRFKTMIEGGSDVNATFKRLIEMTLGETLVKAIQSSALPKGIKNLFSGLTNSKAVSQTVQASIKLLNANVQLKDQFNLTANNAAVMAKEVGLSGSSLVKFVDKLTATSNSLVTPAQQILAVRDALSSQLGRALPETIQSFDEILKSFNTATKSGRNLFYTMLNLRDSFIEFNNAITGIKKGVNDAIFGLLTPEQQQAQNQARLVEEFAKFNLAVPQTAQQMIAIGQSIDYTTEAGLTLASQFPRLVSAFSAVKQAADQNLANAKQALIEAFDAERQRLQGIIDNVKEAEDKLKTAFDAKKLGIEDTINKFKSFGDSIKAFRLSLGERTTANADPLAIARQRFDATAALAMKGNEEALGNIQSASTDYLDAFEMYSGDFVSYMKAFAYVSDTLNKVETTAYTQADVAQTQLDALKAQVSKLISIDETNQSIESIMVEVRNTQATGSAAQVALTALNAQQISLLGTINNSVLSVADAIKQYNAAKTAATDTTTATQVARTSVANMSASQLVAAVKTAGGYSTSSEAIKAVQAANDGHITSAIAKEYLRSTYGTQYYANGGAFTNGIAYDPVAFNTGMMGEAGPEAIMPLTSINGRLGVSTNNSEMVKQLKVISEKISRLESAQIATAQNTGKVARIVERADNGDSLNVTVVT